MVDVFISYKSERRKAAAHLAKILECYGYTVWYDYSLVKGRNFAAQIDAKIREAKAVIVLWCSKSVRSEWVADEAALAAKLDRLVPAKIEHCELRVDFDRKDHIDLTGWGGAPRDHALDVLLAALEQKVRRAPQQNFKAICEYEEVWRRFGAPSLKAFALNTPVHADLESRPAPDPFPLQQSVERDWEHYFAPRSARNSRALAGALIAAVTAVLVWRYLPDGAPPVTPSEKQIETIEPPQDLPPLSSRLEILKSKETPTPLFWPGYHPTDLTPPVSKETQTIADALKSTGFGSPALPKPKETQKTSDEPLKVPNLESFELKPGDTVEPWKPAPAPQKAAGDVCDGLLVSVSMPGKPPCIKPGSGESFKDCADCPEMVIVPAGSFMMGSRKDEPERANREGPQHEVTIAKPFAVGRFAVTFAEWDACLAANGCSGYKPRDEGWGRGNLPVINVNLDDAKAYVAWLSKKTGQRYRLLSEAEFEYVARAGTTTPFWWGTSMTPEQANYNSNNVYAGGGSKGVHRAGTVPVKSFEANPWGLYQVHGNVWNWVEDCWHDTYEGAPGDGSAWTTEECKRRVIRGGSWLSDPALLRAASRVLVNLPKGRSSDYGFRVARTLD